MLTITISIPESQKTFIDKQMKAQGFGNVSEYFRTLVRQAQEREADAQLETFLMDGLRSGKESEITQEFWRQLKGEASRLLKKRKTK